MFHRDFITKYRFFFNEAEGPYVSNIVEPEVIGVHDSPRVHGVGDDGRCVAAQVIVDEVAVTDVGQTIYSLQSLAGLQ